MDGLSSTRLRQLLGLGPFDPKMSAWDVYLLYSPGTIWTNEGPPMPSDWTTTFEIKMRNDQESPRP